MKHALPQTETFNPSAVADLQPQLGETESVAFGATGSAEQVYEPSLAERGLYAAHFAVKDAVDYAGGKLNNAIDKAKSLLPSRRQALAVGTGFVAVFGTGVAMAGAEGSKRVRARAAATQATAISLDNPSVERRFRRVVAKCPKQLLVSGADDENHNRMARLSITTTKIKGVEHTRFLLRLKKKGGKLCPEEQALALTDDRKAFWPRFMVYKSDKNYRYLRLTDRKPAGDKNQISQVTSFQP